MQNEPSVTDRPVARTLSVIGSSWTCLILRDLLLHGARRFQDLQISLDGIAPTTPSDRLRTLEQNGVVERRFIDESARAEYVLTQKGRDLGPIVAAMRNWGRKYAGDRLLSDNFAGDSPCRLISRPLREDPPANAKPRRTELRGM